MKFCCHVVTVAEVKMKTNAIHVQNITVKPAMISFFEAVISATIEVLLMSIFRGQLRKLFSGPKISGQCEAKMSSLNTVKKVKYGTRNLQFSRLTFGV